MSKKKATQKKEDLDSKKTRVKEINSILRREYPSSRCHLNFTNSLELLVATILSAQCTDERVNQVTKELFKKYRSAEDYAGVNQKELEGDIRPTGFFRNKAKAIKDCCKKIVEDYSGEVPSSMEELTKLSGVGRKTANVILGNAFGIPGIVVDTHVGRLSDRLGLSENPNPDKIEADLMEIVSKNEWTHFSHLLSDHGRAVCRARKPLCGECVINKLCPSAFSFG